MSKIIVIDPHPIILLGISEFLRDKLENIDLIAVKHLDQLAGRTDIQNPDLLIVGLGINNKLINKIYTIQDIQFRFFPSLIIVYDDVAAPLDFIKYMKAGVRGYLNKSNDLDDLINCIQTVLSGRYYLPTKLIEEMIKFVVKK